MVISNNPVGGNDIRLDAQEKVTGLAQYVEDRLLEGMLYAGVVRCPYDHALIVSIENGNASNIPGVLRIVTAENIPGENGFSAYSQDEPILVPIGATAKMKGAPVALVVAETPHQCQAAVEKVQLKCEVLPYTFESSDALQPGSQRIHQEGNILSAYNVTSGEVEVELASSSVLLDVEYHTSFQEHSALERESSLAYIDENGLLTVLSGTHEPHWQQNWIANAIGIDASQVRFITPLIGGSFGGKQDPWPHIAVGLLAYLVQRPVRLTFSRQESFLVSPKRHPYDLKIKIGASPGGDLTGIQAQIICNTGAYDSDGKHITEYAVVAAGGAYRWRSVDISAEAIYTNAPKCGQFRGFGTPQSTFGLECALDELIQNTADDPIKFRIRNAIVGAENTFLGYPSAETLGYRQVLETLEPYHQRYDEEARDFNSRTDSFPFKKAVGVAGMWYRFGKSGSLRVEAQAKLSLDGKVHLYYGAPDYGQGTTTVMAQLGADVFGISRDQIVSVNGDTLLTPDSGVQGASRATYWVGGAVRRSAEILRDEIIGIAAELLDCAPEALQFCKMAVRNRSKPIDSVSLAEIAKEFDRIGKSRNATGFIDFTEQFPSETRPRYTPHFVTGAHLAEVLVDMETGETKVTRYVAVHDAGKVINPLGAQGQIEGGVLMGIGSALREEYIPGVTTGFKDYILPMIDDFPEINTLFVEVPSKHGPLGAKGLGETAMLPSTPAVINAVSRAIGSRIRRIPATPERIVRKILDVDE